MSVNSSHQRIDLVDNGSSTGKLENGLTLSRLDERMQRLAKETASGCFASADDFDGTIAA